MPYFFRKSLAIILFSFLQGWLWSQIPDTFKITGNFINEPTVQVLKTLEENYHVRFFYKDEWFRADTVRVALNNHTLDEAVNLLLNNKPFTYKIINGRHVVLLPRAEVAMLIGQMPNFSSNGEEDQFTLIGDLSQAGRTKNSTVTGTITDGETGDPIIGATIQLQNLPEGVITNAEGSYRLMLTPGLYTLIVSSVGYEKSQFNIKVISSGEYNIELFDKSVRFDEIVIYGQRLDKNVSSHQMSMVELDIREIGQLPSVSGGKDILKGLTIMPGVKSIGEFSSGINVRGGGEDQNLYLINSAPLFNTAHVFGLISVINPDAVDRLSLYKGHIPANFGERVSSVIDIRTKETFPERFMVRGGIGLYDGRLMVEVPLVKDKIYFDLGGRTSYSNWLLKSMKDYDLSHSKAGFYDLNGTIHANLGKNRIALSGYSSNDDFRFTTDVRYKYGTNAGSLNWSYLFSSNLASYLTLAYSEYKVNKDAINPGFLQSRVKSGLNYSSLKYRIQYGGIQRHNIEAGFNLIRYHIQPGKKGPLNSGSLIASSELEAERGYEGGIFLNDEFSLSSTVIFNFGLRYSAYANTGPASVASYAEGMLKDTNSINGFQDYGRNDIIKFYHGFEPRLSMRIKLNELSSVKLSYNRNIQYISMISYTSVSTPGDVWKLADPFIRPLIANQFAVGYYRNFFNNTIEVSVEAYYKGLTNVVDYKDGAQLEMNPFIETQLLNASGKNYGLEFLLRKNSGKFDGWLTYTYSRSMRKTDGLFPQEIINHNNYYPSSYDRPHDFSILANYHLNRRVRFAANFTYSTGRPITFPEYKYYTGNDLVVYFSDRNKYRIPPYHRLDLTITVDESLRLRKKWKGVWSFSVLNVYGRKNAFSIYYKMDDPSAVNDYSRFNLYKLYLIGRPVPTVSYTFVF